MIRTAVVAYGFSATTFHLPFIEADSRFELAAIVTSKVLAVKAEYPSVCVVASLHELRNAQIDLVVITSPNHCHYEQAAYFLQQGCHVVVEKPFVLNLDHAQQLAALAERQQRQLVVFQNRRWDGDFLTLQSLIDEQRVGDIKRLTSRFDRFRPVVKSRWRELTGDGAGILWDLGPHLLDQMVTLFGKPSALQANITTLRAGAVVDDNFELWLDYETFQVNLGSSSFQAGPNARFLLEGDEGTFIKYGLDPQENSLKLGVDVTDERWGQEPSESWGILYKANSNKMITTKPGNYGAFWHQLASAIEEGGASPVPIVDSILVIKLLALAHESARLGCRLLVD